jgi:hypothetical protein
MKEIARTFDFTVPAVPERVFPLLCPVLEYRWIPYWRCELLHSRSGVAEEDCIFRTDFPGDGSMTWVVSRYEPPARIEFTSFVPGSHVMRLKIAVAPTPGGSHLTWTRRWLAVSPQGEEWIARWSEADAEKRMESLRAMLIHYLETGEMLHP